MQAIVSGKLASIYKNKDFTSKDSGEVKVGKWQLQFMSEVDMGNGLGKQLIVEKISIPDKMYEDYASRIGEDVEVKVGYFASKNQVIFYGIE